MFDWKRHPEKEELITGLIDSLLKKDEKVRSFVNKITSKTFTRTIDWVDHLVVEPDLFLDDPEKMGLDDFASVHPDGISFKFSGTTLPPVVISDQTDNRIAIKVEDLSRFIEKNGITGDLSGRMNSSYRTLRFMRGEVELMAVERRGYNGFQHDNGEDLDHYNELRDRLSKRERTGYAEGISDLRSLLSRFESRLTPGRIADAFFRSERRYWESRNSRAMLQWMNQDGFGLGWGNHDHHTFRCSREHYRETIGILEMIGMDCRERFYAGDQAGWGAQVLEHQDCGITVFADVDLKPDEKDGDCSHDGLEEIDDPGTVGLWVGLHGESMLSAGLHHIAVLVDFDRAVMESGIATMAPFSNFNYLKQCFTEGETWKVLKKRVHDLSVKKRITKEQLERFVAEGALGSHLEFIERREGFKGFNQTAVSDIISRTDPRN
jgi:hypothetical protein